MHTLNILTFQGRLGNQMFLYAHALEIMHQEPLVLLLFRFGESIKPWHGPNVFQVFDIKERWRITFFLFIKHYCPALLRIKPTTITSSTSTRIAGFHPIHFHEGYYQELSIVQHNEKDLRHTFSFRTKLLNQKTREIVPLVMQQNSISIHVRRTDYLELSDTFDTFSIDYYHQALKHIEEKYPNRTVYIFSDDIKWCKDNLVIPNAYYVDWNTGKDYWQDMYLMSCCHHNIIANSTFSWWGAWLNTYPEKIVIAPKLWTTTDDGSSLIPKEWIRI